MIILICDVIKIGQLCNQLITPLQFWKGVKFNQNQMKKVFLIGCMLFSVAAFSQGKVQVTDAETGITYLTSEVRTINGGTEAVLKNRDMIGGGGIEIAAVMANPNGAVGNMMWPKIRVIGGPAERSELYSPEGDYMGMVKLCHEESSWPCMIIRTR